MFGYDAQLRDRASQAPATIGAVIAVMEEIGGITADDDGLKWFNWLYLEVTRAVAARVAASDFRDAAWMTELDVQFARLYFGALAGWLDGQPTPGCWRALFERRGQASIARIQFALAGINAHINHDLALAIDATCRATGAEPAHGSAEYQDYCALNATLEGLVDTAKRTLMVRLSGDRMPAVSHLEDTLAAWNIVAARELAWRNAEALWRMRPFPAIWSRWIDGMDGLTAMAGKALLAPAPAAATVVSR